LETKREVNGRDNACVRCGEVPANGRSEQNPGDYREHHECDAFLKYLQLRNSPLIRTQAIGWNLKDVLKQSETPTGEDHDPEWLILEFEVPIPREIHKRIGNRQQHDGLHGLSLIRDLALARMQTNPLSRTALL
jgi:hypothetical protein